MNQRFIYCLAVCLLLPWLVLPLCANLAMQSTSSYRIDYLSAPDTGVVQAMRSTSSYLLSGQGSWVAAETYQQKAVTLKSVGLLGIQTDTTTLINDLMHTFINLDPSLADISPGHLAPKSAMYSANMPYSVVQTYTLPYTASSILQHNAKQAAYHARTHKTSKDDYSPRYVTPSSYSSSRRGLYSGGSGAYGGGETYGSSYSHQYYASSYTPTMNYSTKLHTAAYTGSSMAVATYSASTTTTNYAAKQGRRSARRSSGGDLNDPSSWNDPYMHDQEIEDLFDPSSWLDPFSGGTIIDDPDDPESWTDPYKGDYPETPAGDIPWILLMLMLAGYAWINNRKSENVQQNS